MFLEIQRITITCLLLINHAYSQDAQTVKANVDVLDKSPTPGVDPFAKPDVDPFATPDVDPFSSMTSNSNSKSINNAAKTNTQTVVQPTRKTVIETTRNAPLVEATEVSASTRKSSTGSGVATNLDSRTGSGVGTNLDSRTGSGATQTQQVNNVRKTSSSTRSTSINNTGGTDASKISSVTRTTSVVNSGTGNVRSSESSQLVNREPETLTTRRVIQSTSTIPRGPTVPTRTMDTNTETIPLTVTRTKIVSGSDISDSVNNMPVNSRTKTINSGVQNEVNSGVNTRTSSSSVENIGRSNSRSTQTVNSAINTESSSSTRSLDARIRGSNTRDSNTVNRELSSGSTRTLDTNVGESKTGVLNAAGSDLNRELSSSSSRIVDSNMRRRTNVNRPPLDPPGSNSGRIFTEQTVDMSVTDAPALFVRILFRDQRICETCIGDGTDCYLEHPDDCRKYIRCSASSLGAGMEALEMNCAFGTFWSNEANTCDLASDVYCKKDPCMDTRLKAYPSDINCRSYWRCSNGRSHAECCPNGEAFVDGICVPSDSCKVDNDECPYRFRKEVSEKEIIEIKPACHLESVPGNIFAFKMKAYWGEPFICSSGTRFDQNKCTCVPHEFTARLCKPIADLNFTSFEVFNNVRNYIQVNNVTNSQGYGLFNGRAYVAVPYFKNNENIGSHFVIRMRLYHDGKQGYDSQVLASNCKTKTGRELSPSFAILLSKSKSQIIFFASTKQENKPRYGATASISLPFQPSKWTVVELRFLGEILFARVETLENDGSSNVVSDEKVLKGTLSTSVMPLMVGNCNMNDGFVGYIDQVKTYVCDPGQV